MHVQSNSLNPNPVNPKNTESKLNNFRPLISSGGGGGWTLTLLRSKAYNNCLLQINRIQIGLEQAYQYCVYSIWKVCMCLVNRYYKAHSHVVVVFV